MRRRTVLGLGLTALAFGRAPALAQDDAAARERFLEEHARTWMPRFAEAAAAESREPLFRAAAQLLGAVIS